MRKIAILVLLAAVACKGREQATSTTANTTPGKGSTTAAATETGADVGSMMPAYAATMLNGGAYELASKRDKVVLLNVWATWCGPCVYEIPELQAAHDKYASRGLEVVGVSVDEGAPEGVKEFVAERKMTYPVVLDPEGRLAGILQTSVLPTTVLVDRSGKIVWKKIGAIMPNDPEFEKAIEEAL